MKSISGAVPSESRFERDGKSSDERTSAGVRVDSRKGVETLAIPRHGELGRAQEGLSSGTIGENSERLATPVHMVRSPAQGVFDPTMRRDQVRNG